MTELNSNHKITHEKLDLTREDIKKLHPILTLLDTEAQEKDSDFADRLFDLLQSLIEKAERQDRLVVKMSEQLTEATAYLKILTEVATEEEEFGSSD